MCDCVAGGYIKTNNNFALKIEYKQHNASEARQWEAGVQEVESVDVDSK